MFTPLAAKRVVDLTHVLAGPYVTHVLRQLGADVIKIERPGTGDVMRAGQPGVSPPGFGAQFVGLNAGKRSLALDLKQARGQDILRRLVAQADVLVENLRPGELRRLKFDYETVSALNPRLVYCSISGWGQTGAFAQRAGYDQAIQAATGVMMMQGEPGEPPLKIGFPAIDIATGMNGACAVLAALLERERTGRGCRIDVAMADSALMLMIPATSNWTVGRLPSERFGNRSLASSPTSGVFETADGWLSVAANTPEQGRRALQIIGRPELQDDPRFALAGAKGGFFVVADLDGARAAFAAALRARSAGDWETAFNEAGIACAAIRSIDAYLDGAYRQTPGVLHGIARQPGYDRPVETLGAGFRVDAAAVGADAPAPALGGDSRSVLRELGLSDDDIVSLERDNVVQAA
ncbi:MAG: CoA transferase [Alphaproteobacteria bacterium]|nr:CoA transferase [Alphaproteobacteria bacterium]